MNLLTITCPIVIIFTQMLLFAPAVSASSKPGESQKTVKIGLLIPDSKSIEARLGAEMAIRQANEKGGWNHQQFQLVTRSMEGPWGTGSKVAVDLIFREEVCAILGSHNSRNAHLVEQVSTKARIVFLSAWASDPTLSQAFVPWYFSCVPNDLQQADALIKEIFIKRKLTGIATVSDNGYDGKQALSAFLKKIKKEGKAEPLQLFYDNGCTDFNVLIDKLKVTGLNGIVLFGPPSDSRRLIRQIRQRKISQPIFGSLSLMDENEFPDLKLNDYERVILVYPRNYSGSIGLAFRNEFQKKYGKTPGAVASYAFDGMNLILEAVKNSELDREKIQKSLSKIRYAGVTGPIQFDDKGNRTGLAGLAEIKNGIPVTVEE